MGLSAGAPATFCGTGRSLVAELPYAAFTPVDPTLMPLNINAASMAMLPATEAAMQPAPTCCGITTQHLRVTEAEKLPANIKLDYRIIGGFNNNAITVSWEIEDALYTLHWIALKTFTGMQMKYLLPHKKPPVIFALADEDAYAYCGEDPCLECVFMCKRGFVIYAFIEGFGLVRLPLTRMVATGASS
ncbi:MAG: hypothetical protein RR362_00885 [Raoultibacter sp.]